MLVKIFKFSYGHGNKNTVVDTIKSGGKHIIILFYFLIAYLCTSI